MLGVVFLSQSRLREAKEHFERALTISLETAHGRSEASATANLGIVFARLGHHPEAQAHFEQSLAMLEEVYGTDSVHLGAVLHGLAKFW